MLTLTLINYCGILGIATPPNSSDWFFAKNERSAGIFLAKNCKLLAQTHGRRTGNCWNSGCDISHQKDLIAFEGGPEEKIGKVSIWDPTRLFEYVHKNKNQEKEQRDESALELWESHVDLVAELQQPEDKDTVFGVCFNKNKDFELAAAYRCDNSPYMKVWKFSFCEHQTFKERGVCLHKIVAGCTMTNIESVFGSGGLYLAAWTRALPKTTIAAFDGEKGKLINVDMKSNHRNQVSCSLWSGGSSVASLSPPSNISVSPNGKFVVLITNSSLNKPKLEEGGMGETVFCFEADVKQNFPLRWEASIPWEHLFTSEGPSSATTEELIKDLLSQSGKNHQNPDKLKPKLSCCAISPRNSLIAVASDALKSQAGNPQVFLLDAKNGSVVSKVPVFSMLEKEFVAKKTKNASTTLPDEFVNRLNFDSTGATLFVGLRWNLVLNVQVVDLWRVRRPVWLTAEKGKSKLASALGSIWNLRVLVSRMVPLVVSE